MVHSPQAHFLPDLFAEADHGNAEDCGNLVNCLLFLLLVIGADVKHALNLENVTRSRVGAGFDDQGQEFTELSIFDNGSGLNGCISQILFAKEEETETEGKKTNERILFKVLLFLLH